MEILFLIIIVLTLIFFIKGIKIVKQQEVILVERLGIYDRMLCPGLHFIIPGIENTRGITTRKTKRTIDGRTVSYFVQKETIDLKETFNEFLFQNIVTRYNETITIKVLIYFQIIDPKKAVYAIENLPEAIEKLTQIILKELAEQYWDGTLVSIEKIKTQLKNRLEESINHWGVKINRIEIQENS